MPELRTDCLTGRAVLVAENRARRPNEFSSHSETGSAESSGSASPFDCPFCVGNESRTPPSVYEQMDEAGSWQLRVVPNMFPAVELAPSGASSADGENRLPALGAHEVIVESALHADRMSALPLNQLQRVLEAYRDRLAHSRASGRFGYGLVFKNQGAAAGASLAHVHSQLITLPEVPPVVVRELQRAAANFREHQDCPYCRLLQAEIDDGRRIVLHRDGVVAFCPFASLQPLECWLMPTAHEPSFEVAASDTPTNALADVLFDLIRRLEAQVPGAAYNMLVRTAPWQAGNAPWCHWRIEFLPRIAPLAGLELATGVHINPLPPEQAAHRLRAS